MNEEETLENEEQVYEQPEAESVEQEESNTQQSSPKEQDSAQARNFRELREAAAQLKRERDEALQKLQQSQKKSNSDDEDFSIAPDDLVEGKHLSKFQKKINHLEEQLKQYQTTSSELAVETKLKNAYPDFDKVVNQQTISSLRDQYPELADTIHASGNLYNKAVSAYTLIKKLNLAPDDETIQDQRLAEQNKHKPRSLATVKQADSPLSRANAFANGLNDDLRKELWREMEEARKNL